MIGFIEGLLGVKYPWPKYDQVTGRDLPFSMENTSCTLHGYYAQLDARDLSEGVSTAGICHELFHQWFGDLVTAESWSNLALNESFADLIETVWTTYKKGKDAGDAVNYQAMKNYLRDSAAASRELVRFYYTNKFEMQDYAVTYVKGGRILNMLRNYVGDSAFYASLKLYLDQKKFKSAEAQELRLAFEETTGMDLNWYWNQ
jgi:aminopeptidase N